MVSELQNEVFTEPGSGPAVGSQNKWERGAARRKERFCLVLHGLQRLMHWAKAERHDFMSRVLGVAPASSRRVEQGHDADLPRVEDIDAGIGIGEASENNAKETDIEAAPWPRCSSVKKPAVEGPVRAAIGSSVRPAVGGFADKARLFDLLNDTIMDSATVADAALELDAACGKLRRVTVTLSREDIAQVLAKTASNTHQN